MKLLLVFNPLASIGRASGLLQKVREGLEQFATLSIAPTRYAGHAIDLVAETNLESYGLKLSEVPTVLQFNKRDLPSISSVDDMEKLLNRYEWPSIESVAIGGSGPLETLKMMATIIAKRHARLLS